MFSIVLIHGDECCQHFKQTVQRVNSHWHLVKMYYKYASKICNVNTVLSLLQGVDGKDGDPGAPGERGDKVRPHERITAVSLRRRNRREVDFRDL